VTAGSPGVFAYCQHATSFASRTSWHVRQKMFQTFMEYAQPVPEVTILDIGGASDDSFQEPNYFEQLYPYPYRITCVGTEDGSHLEERYSGLSYRRVQPGQPLPFATATFDIVFSNAVIQPMGSRGAQAAFVRELCRVGKAFFITTPNRWFQVGHHSGLPLLHFPPTNLYRNPLRRTRYRYWAREGHLNMLTEAGLAMLFPPERQAAIRRIRLAARCFNLVVLGRVA
jgi:hypothetical protein